VESSATFFLFLFRPREGSYAFDRKTASRAAAAAPGLLAETGQVET
jgi:hypothetical protein